MGSPSAEENPTEAPQHLVRIPRPFYIGRFPVTQAQWTAVMGKNPSKHRGDPRLPVDQASWFDARSSANASASGTGGCFGCPARRSGSMRAGRGRRPSTPSGTRSRPTQANFTPYATRFGPPPSSEDDLVREMELAAEADEATGGEMRSRRRLAATHQTPGASTTCTGTWTSGARTCGTPTTKGLRLTAVHGSTAKTGNHSGCVRGGWASATEFVCTSSARRQLRADAGSREEDGEDDEGDGGRIHGVAPRHDVHALRVPGGLRVSVENRLEGAVAPAFR